MENVHPVIQVPNQLVGAPLGTDVTIECYVEASPKSINYWIRDSGEAPSNRNGTKTTQMLLMQGASLRVVEVVIAHAQEGASDSLPPPPSHWPTFKNSQQLVDLKALENNGRLIGEEAVVLALYSEPCGSVKCDIRGVDALTRHGLMIRWFVSLNFLGSGSR
ncbi:unnamed protein product [Timema podura]|uniref:Ig-like domain-containing protein n=1 Tax=Timema podura TaxID=61482 RepID=A0ABN7NLL4_TIMPD|nr:unnamed protein product [Timema podura]